MVQRQAATPAPAQYLCHWGEGYQVHQDETQPAEFFRHASYSDKDRQRIERLKPGASLDLTQHLPEGYTPRALVHTVTRTR